MRHLSSAIVVLIAGLLVLSACRVPQGAAEQRQILAGADDPDATFAVEFVTETNLAKLKSWPHTGRAVNLGWIKRSRGPGDQLIEPGDMVDISVWDNEENSLLLTPTQKVVDLKGMRVSQSGTVFMPYVDEIYIAKMTPDKARQTIQDRMGTIIPSAQVQLGHTAGRKSTVDLVSGTERPGNYPLPDRDFTVTALIATGGGVETTLKNPQVRLMRDGKLYGLSLDSMFENPSLDTTLRGGDKVFLEDDDRYFLALGATGREAQIDFPQDRVTALDAMSLIGGVNDNRGDPKGILVLRDYPESSLRSDESGPPKERMIFALDLTTADGLFSAGEFLIHDRDLVLATESQLTTSETVLRVFGSALGIAKRL
jgi:polysaccharide export outer membrane protein